MLRVETSTFLDEVDSSYFNEKMTSIEIYAKNVNLPSDQAYFNNVSKIRLVNCRLNVPPPMIPNYFMLSVLDLCDNKITEFPSDFFTKLQKLSSLDLSSNKLKNLNCVLPPTLTNLNLSYNESLDVESIWKQNLPSLTTLRLSFCNINDLPSNDELPSFANSLTCLNLDGNNLTKIPSVLSQFSVLDDLSLFGNNIDEVDQITFSHLLRSFNISYNKLEDPNKVQFSSDTKINSFVFSANIIKSFPSSLFNISEIKILSLIRIKLSGIVDVEFPPSLIAIDFSHNKITGFSEKTLKSMQNLIALNISFNKIEELPDAFPSNEDGSIYLSKFFADHNQLKSIPDSLLSSPSIEHLSVAFNELNQIGPFKWPRLKSFNCSFNHLKELPDSFESSSLLQEVNFSFNELSDLPKSLSHCRKVISLIASSNKFICVPHCIMAFSQLKILSLSGNKLTTLPKGFGSFFFLRFLDLSNNNFSVYPTQISTIRSMWFLSFSHNCLTELPFPPEPSETESTEQLSTESSERSRKSSVDIVESIFPPELRLLDLSFNKLTKFSMRSGTLQKLQSLSLDYNQLSVDQLEFSNLKSVQFLSVSCNASKTPIVNILTNILSIPTLTHFEYLNNDDKVSIEVPLRVHILDDSRCSVTKRFSVGYSATMGDRPSMEDSIGIEEFDDDNAIFVVCDGHSGGVASATAAKCLCCEFKMINEKCTTENKEEEETKVVSYVQNSFQKINNLLKSMNINDGCTAALAYIRGKKVFAAGIGDSRIVRVMKKGHQRVTVDAKPYNRKEYDRLRNAGLKVSSDYRINKKLAVARALGDFWCDDGLFVLPDVQTFEITGDSNENEDDEDVGIIIACDGLWDVMPDEMAAEIVRQSKTGADAAVKLKNYAFGLQSKDNISVIVVLFHPKEENQRGMSSINTVEVLPNYEDPDDDEEAFLALPAIQGRRRR